MALMIMGRREWCSQVPRHSARALWFFFLPTTPGVNSVWPPGRPPLPSSLLPPIPIHISPREHTPRKNREKEKKNNSQQDICFIYLTNYLSGNVPPVPLIGSQELDRDDGDRDGRWVKEKQEEEVGLRASLVPVLIFLLLCPLFSLLWAAASLRCMNKWQSCKVINCDTFISMNVCFSSLCHLFELHSRDSTFRQFRAFPSAVLHIHCLEDL